MHPVPVIVRYRGIQPYRLVWQQMQQFTDSRTPQTNDEIWVLQHPPVYTLGRNTDSEHLLKQTDIPQIQIDRGGQVTYHGPGQVIAYLLLDLRRLNLGVRALVSRMEQSIVSLLSSYDIVAFAKKDAPGVYTNRGKIAALGLRIRRGYCFHGLSLNVNMNLHPFEHINPCGYAGLAITQMADYVPDVMLDEVARVLVSELKSIYR